MEKFDVIVVGAGLGGLATAYCTAKSGLNVLVLERGTYPGSKNMTGGRIYLAPIKKSLPDINWTDAPLERPVTTEIYTLLDNKSALSISLNSEKFGVQSYTILRAKFDRWFAEKVEDKGATIIPKMRVDDIVREKHRVVGVSVSGDKVQADVVVIAEGANSILAEKANLKKKIQHGHYAIGVKETIALPKHTIEERFNLGEDEGSAQLIVGGLGVRGGGFIYTNIDSISVGVVVGLQNGTKYKVVAYELLEKLKSHKFIRKLIRGGTLLEYSAHLILEGGYYGLIQPFDDGVVVVGDAAGFSLNMGLAVKGMDYAIVSGVLAADAITHAKTKNDFSKDILSYYQKLLTESYIIKEIETFKRSVQFLANPRIYNEYPRAICELLGEILYFDAKPKQKFSEIIFQKIKSNPKLLYYLLTDLLGGVKSF